MRELCEHYNIPPVCILSDCSFRNLMKHGIEEGSDICIHEENETTCDDCSKAKPTTPWYPPLTLDTILRILLIIGVPAKQVEYDNVIDYIKEKGGVEVKQFLTEYITKGR